MKRHMALCMWNQIDLLSDLELFCVEGCEQAGVGELWSAQYVVHGAVKRTCLAATGKLQHLGGADRGCAACLQFGDASNVRAVLDVRERMMKGESQQAAQGLRHCCTCFAKLRLRGYQTSCGVTPPRLAIASDISMDISAMHPSLMTGMPAQQVSHAQLLTLIP